LKIPPSKTQPQWRPWFVIAYSTFSWRRDLFPHRISRAGYAVPMETFFILLFPADLYVFIFIVYQRRDWKFIPDSPCLPPFRTSGTPPYTRDPHPSIQASLSAANLSMGSMGQQSGAYAGFDFDAMLILILLASSIRVSAICAVAGTYPH